MAKTALETRLAALERAIQPKRRVVRVEMSDAQRAQMMYTIFNFGEITPGPGGRAVLHPAGVHPDRHTALVALANGLNRWREATGVIFVPLVAEDAQAALDAIASGQIVVGPGNIGPMPQMDATGEISDLARKVRCAIRWFNSQVDDSERVDGGNAEQIKSLLHQLTEEGK